MDQNQDPPDLTDTQRMQAIDARLDDGGERMDRIEAELKQLAEKIGDLLALIETLRGGMRVLEVVGKIAKPIAALIGAWLAVKAMLSGAKP